MRSLTKIKEENRILIRETAKELKYPYQGIEDYDEWLENVIDYSNDKEQKYDNKMKATLILQFFKRMIHQKTGILLNRMQWHQLPDDGLIRWPNGDKTKSIFHLPVNHLNEILRRLDLSNLSKKILESIKPPRKSTSLETKITIYFQGLLKEGINWKKKIIPWKKLSRADFQNWPDGVPVKRPLLLARVQRMKLYDVLESIQLSESFKKTYKERLVYSYRKKQALISQSLRNIPDFLSPTCLKYFLKK